MGGFDADRLCGGKGNDVFTFYDVTNSTPTRRDVIAASDGAPAFEGAGKVKGDLINLADMDADLTDNTWSAFVFGGTGKGHVSLVDSGRNTLVRGNVDDDRGFDFRSVSEDAEVKGLWPKPPRISCSTGCNPGGDPARRRGASDLAVWAWEQPLHRTGSWAAEEVGLPREVRLPTFAAMTAAHRLATSVRFRGPKAAKPAAS